jgi:hypothetical protein
VVKRELLANPGRMGMAPSGSLQMDILQHDNLPNNIEPVPASRAFRTHVFLVQVRIQNNETVCGCYFTAAFAASRIRNFVPVRSATVARFGCKKESGKHRASFKTVHTNRIPLINNDIIRRNTHSIVRTICSLRNICGNLRRKGRRKLPGLADYTGTSSRLIPSTSLVMSWACCRLRRSGPL